MIGLSLSFCIKDILEGTANKENVTKIISGTKIDLKNNEQVEEIYRAYKNTYWQRYPEEVVRPLFDWAITIMVQPRLKGDYAPNISNGHWIH